MVKKTAPSKLKNHNSVIQHCIDGYYVEEVLKSIPNGITIIGCRIRFGYPLKRKKAVIPRALREVGCNYLQRIESGLEAEITHDQVGKGQIRASVKRVAEYIGSDPEAASFRYIVLSNGTSNGRFVATTKEMEPKGEDAADLRKKLRVLGLETADGKVQGLIADLGKMTGAYRCDFENEIIRKVALCRRVK